MTRSSPNAPRLLTIVAAAYRMSVSTKSVRRWIDAGELHAHKLGRRVRIAEEDLVAFISARRR